VQNVVSNGFWLFGCLMVFNATFNNISVISWQSTFLVEETGETFIYCRDEFSNYIVLHMLPVWFQLAYQGGLQTIFFYFAWFVTLIL
jgi:hypothetical protein